MADKIIWIDANGTEHPFDTDIKALAGEGMRGRFMPNFSFIEDKTPFTAGSRIQQVNIEPRDVDVPIFVKSKNDVELRSKMRDITRMLNPLKGDGHLRSISSDGTQRELACRYLSGFEGDESRDNKGYYWLKAILVFHAADPFWYDTATQVKTFTSGEPVPFFPLFPLRLNSSNVFADTTIDNAGDVETWPEWTVTGPGEHIKLRNLTTGETMYFEHEDSKLGIGESITINTKPFHKKIIKNDGSNLFYTLSDDSSLWTLQDGNNAIRLEMSGATEESSIQLSYRNCYWGP